MHYGFIGLGHLGAHLATSLLPIAGTSLLLRALIQGDYAVARQYVLR